MAIINTTQSAQSERDGSTATTTERRRRRENDQSEEVADGADDEQEWRRHTPQPAQHAVLRYLLAIHRPARRLHVLLLEAKFRYAIRLANRLTSWFASWSATR